MLSPMMAPALATTPTHNGLRFGWLRVSKAALTSTTSPGSGIPRLSIMITAPTIRYTESGGIASSHWSMCTARTPWYLRREWCSLSEGYRGRGHLGGLLRYGRAYDFGRGQPIVTAVQQS